MNILIIGFGSIAHKHVSIIRKQVPLAKIVALRSSGSANNIEGVANISGLSELTDLPDFIIISNPTSLHAESIRKCIWMGKPFMIEKPVFNSLKNVGDILGSITKRNITTYVACNLRFHPVIRFLKNKIQEGAEKINEVNIYCGSFLPEWRPGGNYRTGYSANADMGGGVHLDLIHELDYAFWLFGKPLQTTSLKRSVSSLAIKSVDFAVYNLIYPEYTLNITLNYYRRAPKRSIEIVFDNDIYYCDLLKCEITNMYNEVIFKHDGFQMMDTYVDQMKYFLSYIQAGQQLMNNIDEAYEVLKIALHEEQA